MSNFVIAETPVLIASQIEQLSHEIKSTFHEYQRLFILMDENTQQYCYPIFSTIISSHIKLIPIVVPAGESSKNLTVAENCWKQLFDHAATKNDILISLGGGVVSDLAGFVAALYKRGMQFYSFPTTLMAMTDAALGGKTGIDYLNFKNSIGVFNSPLKIFIATEFLNSLSNREYENGLAEIYKHAIIQDSSMWNELKNANDIFEILQKSIAVKAKVVNNDYHEKGERKILNFGHTIGHALESDALANNIDMLHGEAVVVGMIIESELAFQLGVLSEKDKMEIVEVLKNKFTPDFNLKFDFDQLAEYMKQDKKNTAEISFSLPTAIGSCGYNYVASLEMINKAMQIYYRFK
ncbi:MAG: 3-dehydroquinate synthase [Bacteroidota bacterium]